MIGLAATQRLQVGACSSTALGVAPRLPLEEAGRLYETLPCF
jgi:hypothetical protein